MASYGLTVSGLRQAAAIDASIAGQIIPPLELESSIGCRGPRTLLTHSASVREMIGRTELAAAVRCRLHAGIARRTEFIWTIGRQWNGSSDVTETQLRFYPLVRLVRLHNTHILRHT